jgi:hypothetical protein
MAAWAKTEAAAEAEAKAESKEEEDWAGMEV